MNKIIATIIVCISIIIPTLALSQPYNPNQVGSCIINNNGNRYYVSYGPGYVYVNPSPSNDAQPYQQPRSSTPLANGSGSPLIDNMMKKLYER
jgi:hypothetical protein